MLLSLLNAYSRQSKVLLLISDFVKRRATLLFVVASTVPFLFFLIYYDLFKLNYPQHEDLLSMTFVRHWSTHSWSSLLDEWVSHGFGHRYPFSRSVSLIAALLNGGELDITHTGRVGLLFLMLFYALFTFILYRSRLPLFYSLPLAFLLFQPQLRTYLFWSLINQLYMPSLFFALVAVWLLTKDGWKRVIAALACVVIAVSAFSSGLLGYGAGALVLFLRKRWGYLAIWCLAAILTAALYFRNYTQPGWGLPEFSPYDNPLSVWLLIRYIILYIGGILHFHPTSVSESTIYNPAHWGSYLLGLASSSIIMYTLLVAWAGNWPFLAKRIPEWMQKKSDWWQRYPRIRLFITGAVALLFVTIYMVVNGRTTPEYGDQLFKPRLILYPTITVAMAYMMALWLAGRFRQRVFVTSLFLALIYCFLSYFYRIDSRIREKRFHTTSLYNYLHNKPGFMNDFGTWGGGNQKYNKPNVDSAILAGVYKPTDPAFLRHARLVSPERTDLPKLTIKYDSRNNTYTFRSRDLRIAYRHYQNYYLVLRSSASQFVLSLTPGQTSLTYFLRTGQYYAGDIATDVTAFSLPEGKYRVGVLAHLNNPYYSFQPDSITIQRKRPSEWW